MAKAPPKNERFPRWVLAREVKPSHGNTKLIGSANQLQRYRAGLRKEGDGPDMEKRAALAAYDLFTLAHHLRPNWRQFSDGAQGKLSAAQILDTAELRALATVGESDLLLAVGGAVLSLLEEAEVNSFVAHPETVLTELERISVLFASASKEYKEHRSSLEAKLDNAQKPKFTTKEKKAAGAALKWHIAVDELAIKALNVRRRTYLKSIGAGVAAVVEGITPDPDRLAPFALCLLAIAETNESKRVREGSLDEQIEFLRGATQAASIEVAKISLPSLQETGVGR